MLHSVQVAEDCFEWYKKHMFVKSGKDYSYDN